MTKPFSTEPETKLAELAAALCLGDVRALARAISLVENQSPLSGQLLELAKKSNRNSLRIGITGPPGAGKSTLVDQLAQALRNEGRMVGILAIDPSSPITGGAVLGDRIRVRNLESDLGIFLRSMATRGELGGLARASADVLTLMEASGKEVLLIETVGVGQDEVEVAAHADLTVVVLVPGLGDSVQSMKAGILEVADIFVINKADREGADRVAAELLAMLSHGSGRQVPILKTIATEGVGVTELLQAIQSQQNEPLLKSRRAIQRALPVGSEIALDHIGIAVRSIEAASSFYQLLGLRIAEIETIAQEEVRVAMLPLGATRIELIEPTIEQSSVGRFLQKRGEGLHHIALRVPQIAATLQQLKATGLRLVKDEVQTGAGGHRYFFVHPSSTGGVLVEIVGHAAEESPR